MASPIQGEVAILENNTVNANITNSSLNVNVVNTPNVNITNSSLNVVRQPNATLLGSLINGSVTANTNIFSSALSISSPSRVKIIVVASASGVLTLEITSGTTTVSGAVNSGSSLTANAWYEFEIDLPDNVSINLQYSVAATMTIFVLATPLG